MGSLIKQKSSDNSKNECMRYKGACSPLPPPPPYYDDYLSELSVSAVWLDVTKDIKVYWWKCKIVHDMTQSHSHTVKNT